MKSSWMFLCLLVGVSVTEATVSSVYATVRCDCNGRSRYCLRDWLGLRCVNCQGNSEGRHCERCEDGFYQRGTAPRCTACRCNAAGSVSNTCDSKGRCRCKDGVTGDKCERCPGGAIGPGGCPARRPTRQDSGRGGLMCFCSGHSARCSPQTGYSVHDINSTFAEGPEGWRAATAQGLTPPDVHFRWSPGHQDLEVISRNSQPIYVYAPDRFLGDRVLSYGQNLSFSLRLDRGVRRPSASDVVLEGSGLRVSTSLGDLRAVVPCGQKIHYSFRLDERPSSKWNPSLSPLQFQTLLQNLTAIKIRATFGDAGRGYLDNVQLVTARRGPGVPAGWVQTCVCPPGYSGDFCQSCAPGFRRSRPAAGAPSGCEPCSCRGGSCDPQTGDCFLSDETRGCAPGFYRDPRRPRTCLRCPCAEGVSCSPGAEDQTPRCDRCPPGTTGLRCDECQEGYYGDPCRPCPCNGHIDVRVPGSCDVHSGECLRCVNNTQGARCERCLPGFTRQRLQDACTACGCSPIGSESPQCEASGRCRCRPGFEGAKCQLSGCPSCFGAAKAKVEEYADKLRKLEALFSEMDGGGRPSDGGELEASLTGMEQLVDDLRSNGVRLAEMEEDLQRRLASLVDGHASGRQDVQNIGGAAGDIRRRQQTYRSKAAALQDLLQEMKLSLQEAQTDLRNIEVPAGDSPAVDGALASLVKKATDLANKHQAAATAVERSANDALGDSEKGLGQVRTLMNKENRVHEMIGDLKDTYDQASARVKTMGNQAAQRSGDARGESKMAADLLEDVSRMEKDLPTPLTDSSDALTDQLEDLRAKAERDISDHQELQGDVQRWKTEAEDLMNEGRAAQKGLKVLGDRVDTAKAAADGALDSISGNTAELDAALSGLKDFNQQIDKNKKLAKAAIQKLPAVSDLLQQASSNNQETQDALADMGRESLDALGTIGQLGELVDGLEGALAPLSHADLLDRTTRLRQTSNDLKTTAGNTAEELLLKLGDTRRMEADADQAADGAAAALNNVKLARGAVKQKMEDIRNLLANINQTAPVDESYLRQLEDSLSNARKEVEGKLRTRLKDMEDQTEAHRRQLSGINRDIDTIMTDVGNLEHILKSVPAGCFNSPPIEEP